MRTLSAVLVATLTVIILLTIALASLETWQAYILDALFPSSVIDHSVRYVPLILTAVVAGVIWTPLVILPAAIAGRFATSPFMRFIAAATTGLLSALAFVGFHNAHSFQPLWVFLLIGGVIGLAGFAAASWKLPSDSVS